MHEKVFRACKGADGLDLSKRHRHAAHGHLQRCRVVCLFFFSTNKNGYVLAVTYVFVFISIVFKNYLLFLVVKQYLNISQLYYLNYLLSVSLLSMNSNWFYKSLCTLFFALLYSYFFFLATQVCMYVPTMAVLDMCTSRVKCKFCRTSSSVM